MEKGFTLIEFLIYITVTTVALVLVGSLTTGIFWGKTSLATSEEVGQNARLIMERIASAVRNADGINSPLIGQSDGSLSLSFSDSDRDPTVFSLSGDNIVFTENGGSESQLNSDYVKVTSLNFANVSYEDTPGAVRTVITIEYRNPGERSAYDFEKTFYLTTALRNM